MATSRSASVTSYQLKAFRELVQEMRELQVFHVKLGDWEIQMSQYAFVPKQQPLPVQPQLEQPSPIEAYPEIMAPFQAFKPWVAKPPKKEPLKQAPYDPVDPSGSLDDEKLFLSDLPMEH